MTEKCIFKSLKQNGCCDACCLRYLGLKNSTAYENIAVTIKKFSDVIEVSTEDNKNTNNETEIKKQKMSACIACLGILQKETWNYTLNRVKEKFSQKSYDSSTFACGLSSPTCLLLRAKAISLYIDKIYPERENKMVTPLKEAWKYVFGDEMSRVTGKSLDSGQMAPLLVTVNFGYKYDRKELDSLEKITPAKFAAGHRRRDFFSRNNVEKLLTEVTYDDVVRGFGVPPVSGDTYAECQSVETLHTPIYFGGRYIKLSRELSQTPWIINGVKNMESSVQDVIFEPLARILRFDDSDRENKMKLVSAGREDVDVRCLGNGRPFAVEVADPHLTKFAPEELEACCAEISKSGSVLVNGMCLVDREELALLKKGEESKTKTYRALCIKLTEGKQQCDTPKQNGCRAADDVRVTEEDLSKIKACKNLVLTQLTPLRVLHRRPLLARSREVYEMDAHIVEGHANLFILTLKTQAGTYVKEFVHGDFGRTTPSLSAILNDAQVDILALDVMSVDLDWPVTK